MISFMNRGAGAQQALMRLAQQLGLRGHDVEIWFLYRKADVDTGDLKARCVLDGKVTPARLVLLPFYLMRALRAARPDAVISFLPLANTLGLLSAWLTGIRVRVASHRAPGNTYSAPMRLADKVLGSLGLYTAIVCVSHAVRQSFQAYPPNYRARLKVVHNGIAWKGSETTRAEARRKLGLPASGFLFVAAGRLSKQKNYFFLLEAFARTTNSLLAIAGDGELEAELKAFAQSHGLEQRVVFLGALEREQIPGLLRSADAFVSSSLFEGQSNAVLEAMHEGLPILVGDIPEQRETVVNEVTGEESALLASVTDTDLWAAQLQRLIDSADLRQQLANSARQMVARRFAVERMIDGFEQVLTSSRRGHPGVPEPHCP
jgi:glycosyltransferase involved in cell wall biosynthesis